jgi:hypothetical protein
MKVVSYSQVIPKVNKNIEKKQILEKFVQGVNQKNDTGILHNSNNLVECDVAVIQGWVHEKSKNAPHLLLRQQIIDFQKQNQKYVCVADSNLFLYATNNNSPHHYLRYSFNDVFPNKGIYCDDKIDANRWKQISKDLNIQLEDNKFRGKNILLCLQRNGGWSMGNVDINNWIESVVSKIRKYSDRPIVLRPHPKDNDAATYLKKVNQNSNIKISYNKTIEQDLEKAWCVVNHNSSSIVGAIIKGHSAFITDPHHSQCAEVANTDFSLIERPLIFDRIKWLERISMFHWKFSELENGSCWEHMRNYCQ